MQVPLEIHEVEPEFCAAALGRPVASVRVEQIGLGVGMLGQLARLHLGYPAGVSGPASVVLKLPTQTESRQVGDFFRLYERECGFYQHLAAELPVRVPHCHWLRNDATAQEFALVLEDFTGRTHVDQLEGVDTDHARAAVHTLALLHATWWESPRLAELPWLPRMADPITLSAGGQYRQSWPRFLDLFGELLPARGVELGERVQAQLETFFLVADQGPHTLFHGDFRVDNLMFDDDAHGAERVGVVDWQICSRGPGVSDLAYFLCQSLTVADRRRQEVALLEQWYDELARRCGDGEEVPGYPFATAWRDYRRAVLVTTLYPVIAGAQLDLSNERSRALAEAMTERAFSAALDHDGPELYPTPDEVGGEVGRSVTPA